MCDVKKYSEICKEIVKLQPQETLQLSLESATEEERAFYAMIGNYLLQTEQRKVIGRNLF